MQEQVVKFFKSDDGATAIEYGLIAAVVVVVIIGAMLGVGEALTNIFTGNDGSIGAAIDGAMGS